MSYHQPTDQKLQGYNYNNPLTDGTETVLKVINGTLSDVVKTLTELAVAAGLTEIPKSTNYVEIQVMPGSEVTYTEDGSTTPASSATLPIGWIVNGSDAPPYDHIETQGLHVANLKLLNSISGVPAYIVIKFGHKETLNRNFLK